MAKNWNELICSKCSLINDYTIIEKSNQLVCICNGCGNFLGNKPKDNYNLKNVRLPFGKYKGELVQQMTDLNYLRWLYDNTRLTGSLKASVKFKINR